MKNQININDARQSCQKYYDRANQSYFNEYSDELDRKPYDQEFLARFAKGVEASGKILDIGCCSTVQQGRYFRDMGFRVTSIDLSKECIETAKQHFTGIEFIQMDMTDMSFDDHSFDAIIAFYSIIHIPDEKLPKLFSDFQRIVKPGGQIGITVHTGDFYGYYDENDIPVFYRTYAQDELRALCESNGFRIEEMEQRPPIYDFEFQSERIYLIARKN